MINEQNMNKREQEKRLIELRRAKCLELAAKGFNNTEIAEMVKSSEPTVSRDLAHLKRQARENIRNYIDEELPNEYHKTLVGLTCIMKEAWTEARNSTVRDKMHALDLAQRAYQLRLELLANSTVVEDSVRFIEAKKNAKPTAAEEQQQLSGHFGEASEETGTETEEDLQEE